MLHCPWSSSLHGNIFQNKTEGMLTLNRGGLNEQRQYRLFRYGAMRVSGVFVE